MAPSRLDVANQYLPDAIAVQVADSSVWAALISVTSSTEHWNSTRAKQARGIFQIHAFAASLDSVGAAMAQTNVVFLMS